MDDNKQPHRHSDHHNRKDGVFWGSILIALGVSFIIQQYWHIDVWSKGWPFIFIIVGLVILLKDLNRS